MQNTPHLAALSLHLVIVDSSLPDLDILLADLPDFARLHYIHEYDDALSQMARAASQYRSLKGLHVLGHGQPGRMLMGGQWLDAHAMESATEHMAAISGALAEDAHVWLYGCYSAQGTLGQDWLDAWAQAMGVSVHGSDEIVGTVEGERHWILNRRSAVENAEKSVIPNSLSAKWSHNVWIHSLAANTAPSFSAPDGKAIILVGNIDDYGTSVIQQADGKLVLGGFSANGDNTDYSIVRLNTDGSLDSSFGTGGKAIVPVGSSWDNVNSVILQADGKLVLGGGER